MSTSNNLVIRQRTSEDIPELVRLLQKVYNLTGYPVDGPSTFANKLQADDALHSLVAMHDGCLAGHVQLRPAIGMNKAVVDSIIVQQPIEQYASLVSLFVDPNLQGKGIGVALVKKSRAWASREGRRLVLVVLDKDKAAIRMYDRLGWERGVEYMYRSILGKEYKAFTCIAPAQ